MRPWMIGGHQIDAAGQCALVSWQPMRDEDLSAWVREALKRDRAQIALYPRIGGPLDQPVQFRSNEQIELHFLTSNYSNRSANIR
jgi:hypothetical protein